uniref:Gamma-aminobutyric acid receptor subunit beta n=1 Tax=Polyphagotarsonemus latus TaxID=1204166 RepID=A0AAN0LW25_9ACAR
MQCNLLYFINILLLQLVVATNNTSLEDDIEKTSNGNNTEEDLGAHISKILNNFFTSGYDKRVRPNYGGKPVEVGVTMFVISISSVSEVQMDFTSDFYFRQYWKDNRLSFPPTDGITQIFVGAEVSERIWLPDTFFANEKSAYFHIATTKNTFLRITSSGEVLRSIRLTVTASCPMDLQYFPMDRQLCSIEIESYGYSMSDIKYKWQPVANSVGLAKELSLPQFKVLGHRQKEKVIDLTTGNYSRLICEIQFARSLGFYLIQIYIPASLIVVISWVSFWLHRNATPARVSLGVTTVLTMTTLMSSTNAQLPKISYIKSIDVFLGTCFVMVFGSLLEYAIVGYLGKRISMRKSRNEQINKAVLSKLEERKQAANKFLAIKNEETNQLTTNPSIIKMPQTQSPSFCQSSSNVLNTFPVEHQNNQSFNEQSYQPLNSSFNDIHSQNLALRTRSQSADNYIPPINLNQKFDNLNDTLNQASSNFLQPIYKNSYYNLPFSHSTSQFHNPFFYKNDYYNNHSVHNFQNPNLSTSPISDRPPNYKINHLHNYKYPYHQSCYNKLQNFPDTLKFNYLNSFYNSSNHLFNPNLSDNKLSYNRQSYPYYRRNGNLDYKPSHYTSVQNNSFQYSSRNRLNTQLSAYDPSLEESRYSKYASLSKKKQNFLKEAEKSKIDKKESENLQNQQEITQQIQNQRYIDKTKHNLTSNNQKLNSEKLNETLSSKSINHSNSNRNKNHNEFSNSNLNDFSDANIINSTQINSSNIPLQTTNQSVNSVNLNQRQEINQVEAFKSKNKSLDYEPLNATTQLSSNHRSTITATSTRTGARFNKFAKNLLMLGSCKNPNKICGLSPSDIDKYSRVIFPVCFICFNLMYWVIYLHISDDIKADLVPLGS